jgi:eukaryotic-like serine/threonine-protein kinase
MPLAAGTRLGPYVVEASIGAGGMGEVHRARDTRLAREVALKLLPAGASADGARIARFTRETQVVAALNHPHIVLRDQSDQRNQPHLAVDDQRGPG